MIKEKSKTWANLSIKLGSLFSYLPFSPNFYTWLTVPITFVGLLAVISGHTIEGVILFAAAGILDLVDGAVARQTHQTTSAGAFLDGSLDRFIDFLVIFSYFWLPISTPWLPLSQWLYIAIFFAIMPSFEVAYANHRRAVHDPEEKLIWRILNRGEMYILMLLIPLISLYSSSWAGYILVGLVGLSIVTTLQTILITLSLAKSPQKLSTKDKSFD